MEALSYLKSALNLFDKINEMRAISDKNKPSLHLTGATNERFLFMQANRINFFKH